MSKASGAVSHHKLASLAVYNRSPQTPLYSCPQTLQPLLSHIYADTLQPLANPDQYKVIIFAGSIKSADDIQLRC